MAFVGHGAAKGLLSKPNRQRGVGAHNSRHDRSRIGCKLGRALLDVMAEPGQQGCDVAGRSRDFGIEASQ